METNIDNTRTTLVNIVKSYGINNNFIDKILTDKISSFDDNEMNRFKQGGMFLTEFLDKIDFEKTSIFKKCLKAASILSYATGGEQTMEEQYEYSIVLFVLYTWDDIVSEGKDVSKEQLYVLAEYFSEFIAENKPFPLTSFEGDILSLANIIIYINENYVDLLKNCNIDEFIMGTIRDKDIPKDLDEYLCISEISGYRGVFTCLKYLSNRQGIQCNYELYKIVGKLICIINDFASYEKEKAAGTSLNSIIIREHTHNDGKEFVKNYLNTIVLELENQIEDVDNENSMVMLCWILGYVRFEKFREDMKNKERAANSKV